MNMVQMVGIMVACYFVTLILLAYYRNLINIKIGNILFIIADLIFFFSWNYAVYLRGGLENGFMTFDNISQLTMTLVPLTLFMSERVKKYCHSAIAFLWVGMFLALLISPQHAYIFNFRIEANLKYAAESACHLLASLYGAYLILTGQVKCNFKSWRRAVVFIYSIITFAIFLNIVFHKSHFGMDPYGKASIYMFDLFGSFETTVIAYYLSVLVVLTIGMQIGYLFFKLVGDEENIKEENDGIFEIKIKKKGVKNKAASTAEIANPDVCEYEKTEKSL